MMHITGAAKRPPLLSDGRLVDTEPVVRHYDGPGHTRAIWNVVRDDVAVENAGLSGVTFEF